MARINDRTGERETQAKPPSANGAPAPAPAPASAPAPSPGAAFGRPTEAYGARNRTAAVLASCDLSERLPLVVAFLADAVYTDGTTRIPGTVVLFVEDRHFKACLSERGANRKAFLSAPTLTELLETIQRALREGTIEWRGDRGGR